MKRIISIFSLLILLVVAVVSQTTPAAARKDRFAAKLRSLNAIVKELETNYVDTLNADKIMNETIAMMLYQIDPYTEYYPAGDQDELQQISEGQYAGIGAVISKRGNTVIINEPQEDAPAAKAGLRRGDIILTIDGDSVTPDMDVTKVSKRLRGQAGTEITITVRRPYAEEDSILTFAFKRAAIKVNPLPYYGVDSTGVGYILLTTFNESSARRVRQAVEDMRRNPALKGIVLDLRSNGGGLLEGAVQIAGLFVPKGTEIVHTRGRIASDEKSYRTTAAPLDTQLPLVVLTDGGTASASEIVAGSLQDLDRAVIIGDRSYGKGLVQTPRPLPYGDVLKITTARYYIPSGRLIQALDYSNRDADGRPMRTPDSLTNVYRTLHGRTVRDGGGITPDITIAPRSSNRLLYNIVSDMWAYDYATRHVARYPQAPALGDSLVTDSIFSDFKAFIDPERFHYDRQCESALDLLRKAAKVEGYDSDSITAQIDILAALLRHDLGHDLDFNRAAITELLTSELAARYYGSADAIRLSLDTDSVYHAAREVILDPERYKAILRP